MLVCWIADSLGTPSWFEFFRWTTVAYILSRGIAKASRVLWSNSGYGAYATGSNFSFVASAGTSVG